MSNFPFIPQPDPSQVINQQVAAIAPTAGNVPSPLPAPMPQVDINRALPQNPLPPPQGVNPQTQGDQMKVTGPMAEDKLGQQKLGAILQGLQMMQQKQPPPQQLPQPVQAAPRQVQSLGDLMFRQQQR